MPEMRHIPAYATQVVDAVSRARIGWSAREKPTTKNPPNRKIFPEHVQLIAELRKRKLGHRRIQNELARLHDLSFSTATIHKTLERLDPIQPADPW